MFETLRWTVWLIILFFQFQCYAKDNISKLNLTTNEEENFVYITVHNLSDIDIGFVFMPVTDEEQSTEVPEQTDLQPESPIGYEVPCGIRGGNYSNSNRIVGGSNAKPGEFPWQVSIQRLTLWSGLLHLCGGAILSSYWIVTAAHCVSDWSPSTLSVVAGDHDLFKAEGHEQRVSVVRIVTRSYIKENFSEDIALLQISPPLKLDNQWVSPICLPEVHHKFTDFGTVTGWGRLAENGAIPHIMQKVTLPIVNKSTCRRWYSEVGFVGQLLSKCQLCSGWEKGGSDSCQGDSGGPLACRRSDGYYYLCGVVSWGIGCARAKLPGVYTEVSCYSTWIRNIIYNENATTGTNSF